MGEHMASTIGNLTERIWERTQQGLFEWAYTVGRINRFAANSWNVLKKAYLPREPKPFKQELPALLAAKLSEMPDVTIDSRAFSKLAEELYKLLACSLASNRTPDEIISGLQADAEMRDEVVKMLIKSRRTLKGQKAFLNAILSGDEDLRALLNAQQTKPGFPHNI